MTYNVFSGTLNPTQFNSILSFSLPYVRRRTLDVYHTSYTWCGLSANLECSLTCAACGSLKIQDAKNRQKFVIWPPSHNFVGCTFASKARIDNWKKLLKQQYLLQICPHNMAVEISWGVPNYRTDISR